MTQSQLHHHTATPRPAATEQPMAEGSVRTLLLTIAATLAVALAAIAGVDTGVVDAGAMLLA